MIKLAICIAITHLVMLVAGKVASYIDNIKIAVRKLNISKFCNDKIMENSEEYLKVTKLNERKRSNANGVFTDLMDSLYLIVIVSTIIMVSNGESGQGKQQQ